MLKIKSKTPTSRAWVRNCTDTKHTPANPLLTTKVHSKTCDRWVGHYEIMPSNMSDVGKLSVYWFLSLLPQLVLGGNHVKGLFICSILLLFSLVLGIASCKNSGFTNYLKINKYLFFRQIINIFTWNQNLISTNWTASREGTFQDLSLTTLNTFSWDNRFLCGVTKLSKV